MTDTEDAAAALAALDQLDLPAHEGDPPNPAVPAELLDAASVPGEATFELDPAQAAEDDASDPVKDPDAAPSPGGD